MTREEITELQRGLNAFTDKFLRKVAELVVDGIQGPLTNRRIMTVKFYLGYGRHRDHDVTEEFLNRMHHPRSTKFSPEPMLATGAERRKKQRDQSLLDDQPNDGVGHFDGRPAAAWMIPYLQFAREHGWRGTLVSGFRTPAFSESLCMRRCGRPACPGTCAGRSSNHSGSARPAGALDVSDFENFGQIMKRAPFEPPILNALGAKDPVHFSASGH